MIFDFSGYVLDLDTARTRAFYQAAEENNCTCQGCRNFRAAVPLLPPAVADFFHLIGAEPRKAAELTPYFSEDEHTLYCGGFYHLCGRILHTPSSGPQGQSSPAEHTVAQGFSVFFQDEIHLLEAEFPSPVLQMEISAAVPWVLREKSLYLD